MKTRKQTRALSAFLAMVMVVLLIPVGVLPISAATTASGTWGSLSWELDTDGKLTISGTGAMNSFTYSSTDAWRAHKTSIKTVEIENGVTSIGSYAFYYCTGLTSITIPDSVTSIGSYAFEYCRSLTSITIPDSVTSIGDYAFWDCSSLTSITIPDSVMSIGEYAFSDCSSLTNITVQNGNTKYHSAGNCLIETESKTLVAGCKQSVIPADGSVTSIGSSAFSGCEALTSITIPDSVTSIGDWAFKDCSSLTSITIPDSVTSIGDRAFYGCKALTSITIPDSVTSTGYDAFSDCTNLIQKENGVSYVDKWVIDCDTSETSVTLRNDTVGIGHAAFRGCSNLTSITIPNSVTSIGADAFCNCTSLTSITIPDSVTSIGNWAFYYCTSLTSITIPDSVTSIGAAAFEDCTSLTNITIGDNVTSIDNSAFRDCTSLTSITIPDSVTSIGVSAFRDCTSLMIVTLGNSVTSTAATFYGCTSLTSITIPNSVTSIGGSTFYGCSSLTSITIPDSVTSIDFWAFHGCSALTTVYYGGAPSDWAKISIDSSNTLLTNATIVYAECDEHAWDDGEITTEPTCTTDGVKTYTCTACGETKTETVGATGHTRFESSDGMLVANHAGASNLMFTHTHQCADCATVYHVTDYVLSPIAGTVTDYYPATHTHMGAFLYTCYYCDKTFDGVIITIDGSCAFGDWVSVDDTQHKHSCSCGNTEFADHAWDDGEITTAPTCTETGVKTYTCTECGETKTEAVAKLTDHEWNDGVITKAPTYTTTGTKLYTCIECGETKTETLPVLEVTASSPKIVVSNNTTVAGATVRVPILLENNPGVTMMGLDVSFDESVLELIAVEDAGLLKGATFDNVKASPYRLTWVEALTTENNTQNGTIVTLVFRVKDDVAVSDTAITVTYNPGNICNADLESVSFAVVNGEVTIVDYLIGDLNSDGYVTLVDLTILSRHLADWSDYKAINTAAADVNCDGDVTLVDITILARYLAGWEGVTLG